MTAPTAIEQAREHAKQAVEDWAEARQGLSAEERGTVHFIAECSFSEGFEAGVKWMKAGIEPRLLAILEQRKRQGNVRQASTGEQA